MPDRTLHPETIAAQAGGTVDEATGAVVPPIHLSTTFERDPDNQYRRGMSYARPDNPTSRQAESVIAALEGADHACVFASGMAAATTLFLALERPAHVVAPRVMYWALRRWLAHDAHAFGIDTTFVDTTDVDAVAAALKFGNTRLVWLETPANPLWSISDIAAIAKLAHAAGARLACDSTVATPVLTQPLALGADVVVHSATKYLNGHSDVLAGALAFARRDSLAERVAAERASFGAVLAPFSAALLLRGMRTLHLRVRHQVATAAIIADRLAGHPAVLNVLYPGRPEFPGHDIARRQMQGGFGAMLSIRLAGGEAAAIRAAARVEVWKRATSLGGVESLIEHRASVEGPGSICPPDLLRLSAGLEHPDDLIADLERALAT